MEKRRAHPLALAATNTRRATGLRAIVLLATLLLGPEVARAAEADLTTASLTEINAALAAGTLTSEKLVSLYLARIAAYDKAGPKVNCVITLNPHALEQAKALDAERMAKGPRSPIHGIPVVLKDLIDVAGLPTTAGFTPFGAPVPPRDSTVVARIHAAGGIILAKVSTTNWFGKGFQDTHPIGESPNPYNLAYSPGGSSNGSGVAIAASFAPLAVGTDTSISVQSPASNTSSVGIVGTYGMVSRAGIVPRGATQDRPGPIAKTVTDAVTLFSIIAGWDVEDGSTHSALGHHPVNNWADTLKGGSLVGKRIGVLREMVPDGPEFAEGVALFERAIEDLRKAGAQIVDPVLTGNPNLAADTSQPRLRTAEYEKIAFTDAYLARLGPAAKFASTRVMMDAVGFDKFGNSMVTALKLPSPTDSADYQARMKSRQALIALLAATKEKYALDCFILPFSAEPPPPLETGPNSRRGGGEGGGMPRPGVNSLSSSLGLPACVVPMGYTKLNLPIALQFLGRAYSDLEVLQIAYAYEQATKRRVPATTVPPLAGEKFSY